MLARTGDLEKAAVAFEAALKCRPNMVRAHRWLATVYAQDPQQRDKVQYHRLELLRIQDLLQRSKGDVRDRREQLFELPEIPSPEERLAILDRERPLPGQKAEKSGKTFVLVSGLPRSGTSLMMQMLDAGGLQVITDGQREADHDNPKGYYEWEAIKQIAKKPDLLDDDRYADGSAVKVISALLNRMPETHDYKVIFMLRPMTEVVASQAAMLQRRPGEKPDMEQHELMRGLESHRHEVRRWLRQAKHMQVLEVDYPTLVASPQDVIPQLTEFLGDLVSEPDKMLSVIDADLYRQRRSGEADA